MELLDRYLQAIRFWLPKDKQDVVAEIADDIRSESEEKEAALGRPLSEPELEALLKRRGAPLLVAERYLAQQYLIGPVLFPVYRLLLRGVLLYYAGPWMLVWLALVLFVPSYRASHPGVALVDTLHGLFTVLVSAFLALTVGFGLVEKYWLKSWLAREWNPRGLPVVRDENRIPRHTSIAGLAWNAILALWWAGAMRLPHIPDVEVALAPALLQYFYWPILLLFVACCAIAAVNAFSPVWTRHRDAISFAVDTVGALLAVALLAFRITGGRYVELVSPKAGSGAIALLSYWTHFGLAVAFALIGIGFAVSAVQDWRRWHSRPGLHNWMTDLVGGH